MKKLFKQIILTHCFLLSVVGSAEAVDFSGYVKRSFGIENVDLSKIDYKVEFNNPEKLSSDFVKSTAVIYVLSESVIVHFPRTVDETTKEYIRYTGEPLSKDDIASSKNYLMEAAVKHPNEMVRSLALASLERAFVGDLEVFEWLTTKLHDEECDLLMNTTLALLGTSKESQPEVVNILLKKGLQSAVVKQREQTLKAIYIQQYFPQELISDFITCFVTTKKSRRVSKMLTEILKQFPIEKVRVYESFLQSVDQKNTAYKLEDILKWLKVQK